MPARHRFTLGSIAATATALAATTNSEVMAALMRHVTGDWGEISREDALANENALIHSNRLLSTYRTTAGRKFWIITEADRSVTTVLLPGDY